MEAKADEEPPFGPTSETEESEENGLIVEEEEEQGEEQEAEAEEEESDDVSVRYHPTVVEPYPLLAGRRDYHGTHLPVSRLSVCYYALLEPCILTEHPRQQNAAVRRPANQTTPSKRTFPFLCARSGSHCHIAPPPSQLTTEYTPRDRSAPAKVVPPPTSPGSFPLHATSHDVGVDEGPDPSTLPPATAPPSHPSITPDIPGTLDGRSILDVDLSTLAEKPWRRPGSDISDWFNYGFDEMSWEAYCYRRRDLGDLASVLKTNVLVCNYLHRRPQIHALTRLSRILQP